MGCENYEYSPGASSSALQNQIVWEKIKWEMETTLANTEKKGSPSCRIIFIFKKEI